MFLLTEMERNGGGHQVLQYFVKVISKEVFSMDIKFFLIFLRLSGCTSVFKGTGIMRAFSYLEGCRLCYLFPM